MDKEAYTDISKLQLSFRVAGAALGHLLREGEGIVVVIQPENLKCIVYREDGNIRIETSDEDLPNGQMLWVHDSTMVDSTLQ